jgi:hypothetical protein
LFKSDEKINNKRMVIFRECQKRMHITNNYLRNAENLPIDVSMIHTYFNALEKPDIGNKLARYIIARHDRYTKTAEETRHLYNMDRLLDANQKVNDKPIQTDIIDALDKEYYFFKSHVAFLEKQEYLKTEDGYLVWEKGGIIMLAAYFGMLQEKHNPTKNRKWKLLEMNFKVCVNGKSEQPRNLAGQFKDFEEIRRCKSNKHNKEIEELTALINGKINL